MNFKMTKLKIISSFITKFDIYNINIYRQELSQFPNLKTCTEANGMISVDKIQIFTFHLLQLKMYMKSRFRDLLEVQIPNWILDPFSFETVDELESFLQMEFIDIKHDCETQIIFKQVGYEFAWLKIKDTYPQL